MKPRKIATQQRSRATVEALLDATARILVREGYDRASTNRIAEVAGVSIGSLYQYFPSKEALVAALLARHNREMLSLLQTAMAEVAQLDLALAMRRLIAAMIDAHRVDPQLHRIFDEQIPRTGQLAEVEAVKGDIFSLVRSYFEARRGELGTEDLDTAAFISVTVVESLTHEFVIRHARAHEVEVEDFVEQVARLLVSYLQPASAGAAAAKPIAGDCGTCG